jgi:cell division protein FtsX
MDSSGRTEGNELTAPPRQAQLSVRKLLRMSIGSLKHHFTASVLQICTIAATAAFLTYVQGEIIAMRVARALGLAVSAPEGALAQLVWILIVALLVCTISNVTSMLLSVTKRFREIGTMKCLGAFDHSILVLFLVEAMILGGAGALAGAAAGGLFSLLLTVFKYGVGVLTLGLTGALLGAVGATFLVVVFLSFAGAAYPAFQASRMLPIEAMRVSG